MDANQILKYRIASLYRRINECALNTPLRIKLAWWEEVRKLEAQAK